MSATVVRKESIPTNVELFALAMSPSALTWPKPEEVDTSMPWHSADLLATQRVATARAFAADVLSLAEVESVWIADVAKDDFKVCIVVTEIDLDSDLALRERFISLASERLGPGEGDLFIYKRDVAPDWVFQGTQLEP